MTIAKNTNLIPTVCKIFFAPLTDIDSIANSTDRFHRSVTFETGKAWQEVYFTPGTAELTEKPKDTDAGELIEQSLNFLFPGDGDGNLASLDAIINRPSLVKIQFQDSTSKLMGDPDNGAKLTQLSQFSAKGAGSTLEFSCMAIYRACWITT
jgi:hypothetical protein